MLLQYVHILCLGFDHECFVFGELLGKHACMIDDWLWYMVMKMNLIMYD